MIRVSLLNKQYSDPWYFHMFNFYTQHDTFIESFCIMDKWKYNVLVIDFIYMYYILYNIIYVYYHFGNIYKVMFLQNEKKWRLKEPGSRSYKDSSNMSDFCHFPRFGKFLGRGDKWRASESLVMDCYTLELPWICPGTRVFASLKLFHKWMEQMKSELLRCILSLL